MQVQPVKFTGSGIVGTAAVSETINSPLDNAPFDPVGVPSATVVVAQEPQEIVGLAYTGFTAVIVHNGSDNTGDVVAACGAAGTYDWNYEVNCQKGIYLECTGSGTGTVWLV